MVLLYLVIQWKKNNLTGSSRTTPHLSTSNLIFSLKTSLLPFLIEKIFPVSRTLVLSKDWKNYDPNFAFTLPPKSLTLTTAVSSPQRAITWGIELPSPLLRSCFSSIETTYFINLFDVFFIFTTFKKTLNPWTPGLRSEALKTIKYKS